nr:hypothetical protein [uncultured Celeribacter sp.]
MSDPLEITGTTRRSVWVFALPGLTMAEATALNQPRYDEDGDLSDWPLAAALGVHPAPDADFIEVFDPTALDGYGFARYLSEANGMDIGEDAARLDAITDPVVLVFSQALENGQSHFAPSAPLHFAGRYSLPYELPPVIGIDTDSAKGQLPQGKPPKSQARISGMVATVVLIFLAIFVAAFVWVGG